jgi:predicted nucleotidyltransferase
MLMTDGISESMREAIRFWARLHPTVARVYVFGSRAKGTAGATSDLDLGLCFDDGVADKFVEFMNNRAIWRRELMALTGVVVKDLEHADDDTTIAYQAVREHGILLYERS